jgi:hypothetical protein
MATRMLWISPARESIAEPAEGLSGRPAASKRSAHYLWWSSRVAREAICGSFHSPGASELLALRCFRIKGCNAF